MLFEKTKGRTALIDSVFLGLHENMRHARNSQRALVVISDGGDNSSRYTLGELKRLAWEADTQIYAIGIHDHPRTLEEVNGIFLLKDIAERSGGRHFVVRNIGQLADVTAKIGIELHNQYLIGYYPPKELPSGKYRRIRVKLKPPKGLPPLSVYARTGYYVPGG
jgi:Ca-activated chloride channel family protein